MSHQDADTILRGVNLTGRFFDVVASMKSLPTIRGYYLSVKWYINKGIMSRRFWLAGISWRHRLTT